MSGFLDEMASSSAARVAQALRLEPASALEERVRALAPPPPLRLSPAGFDIIAELKLRSPAQGVLGSAAEPWQTRITAYARGGAAAVSVLTEPSRFDGSLEHLRAAARVLAPLGIPAMRKDFIVDPYQVLEARAAGAGGLLLIVRMLSRAQIVELLDASAANGLFVLLEAFDEADLDAAAELAALGAPARGTVQAGEDVLIGVNCRDLQTLEVVAARFAALAPYLPAGLPVVAESGVAGAVDALAMKRLGYRLALIGTALMAHRDPESLLEEILTMTRTR
jgi:indole-3-glycerol phosphate synthase